MNYQELKSKKKITMATLKSFIRKSENIYVKVTSSFSGMSDMVEQVKMNYKEVSKDKAIGHGGVYCVGNSGDYFNFFEDDYYFGISVYNCCGDGVIVTQK